MTGGHRQPMRREHTPYWARKMRDRFELLMAGIQLFPQFDTVGPGCHVARPGHVKVHGPNITLGAYVHMRATPSQRIWLTSWRRPDREGRIRIGDYSLISPGVRIISSDAVTIGESVMLASYTYITDSDWHDTYDRTKELGKHAPVQLGDNVWVGDGAAIFKGVSVGRNSIVGARSVVTGDIPANVIAAGNPAKVVRRLDPDGPFRTRASLFEDPVALAAETDALNRLMLRGNSTWGWLRSSLFPDRND